MLSVWEEDRYITVELFGGVYNNIMNKEEVLINFYIIDSKNELLNKINSKYILGLDVESPREFYKIALVNKKDVTISEFGVFSQICGIKPKIMIIEEKNMILIGYNHEITAIKIEEFKILFELKLNDIFLDIICVNNQNLIIILKETGVQLINYEGKVVWSVETDLITNYEFKDNLLYLDFSDKESIKLKII